MNSKFRRCGQLAADRSKSDLMTEGSIGRKLLVFCVPLILGNLLQQLYNTADSIILGRFVGQQALAAVGSTTTLCNTLIRFFNGISIGAGVIISRDFGEKNIPALQRAVETAMALSVVLGAVVSILALPFVSLLLNMMQTVDELLPEAEIYMRIYVMYQGSCFCLSTIWAERSSERWVTTGLLCMP